MFDEASTRQCNGGFDAWFKRLQIAHIAGSHLEMGCRISGIGFAR